MANRPGSIVEAFLRACARSPAKTCLVFEGQRLSYAACAEQAARWAGALRAWGLRPGDRVGLFLENSPAFLAAYLGTHLAGGIVVLVNSQYRQVELRHILGDAGVCLCVTDPPRLAELGRVADELPELAAVVVGNEEGRKKKEEGRRTHVGGAIRPSPSVLRQYDAESFLAAGSAFALTEDPLAAVAPDAVAVIAYTSGTTGRSKGAMLTHANLAANSAAVTAAWRWTADDYLLLTLPLFHVHGLAVGVHGTWLAGSAVELWRRFDAAAVYERLLRGGHREGGDGSGGDRLAAVGGNGRDEAGVTMFFGVPTMYTRLVAEAERRTERPAPIRLYVSGSAPLSVQTFEDFSCLFGQRILERYGMTETIMNLTNPYDGERRPGTVGQPFPGQEARIVDVQTRQPILDERPGEIQVRGPHVFMGYWRQPAATAAAFDAGGWFNTGDLGWRSADGYYTISGRARELIISGGYNVYPREVEEVLLTHPCVAEAAVFGLPDPDLGEQVAAAVVRCPPSPAPDDRRPTTGDQGGSRGSAAALATGPEPGDDALVEDLVALCRDQLASYKKPRRVFFVDALPRNALGKVQKHVVRQWFEGAGRA